VRIAAACAVLVAAFIGALLVGRGGGEAQVDAPAAVKVIQPPAGDMNAPRLVDTGTVPALHETPEQPSSSSTSSTGSSQTTTSTQSTGSTGTSGTTGGGGGGGGGGGSPQARPPG
jgi:hypothetical protein